MFRHLKLSNNFKWQNIRTRLPGSFGAIVFVFFVFALPSFAGLASDDRSAQPKTEIIWMRDAGTVSPAESRHAQPKYEIVWYRDAGGVAPPVPNAEPSYAVDAGSVPAVTADASPPDASVPAKNPDAGSRKEMGVWCGYFVEGGVRRSYCSPLPLKAAQVACDKKASAHYGFPTECSCSDDKSFLQDRCKGPKADEPVDDTSLLY
jgi:hypothetical protein